MVIGVTGHRPNKLGWGYNYDDPKYYILRDKFKEILIKESATEAVTGMALGVDTNYALAILELKEEGYNIKLHCAIPCLNHSCKWPKPSQDLYNLILNRADIVKVVTEMEYRSILMQKRNEYMVDISNKMIAVWDGSTGGTGNCVSYIKSVNKPIICINPNNMRGLK